jgi:putative membrane protein
MLIQIILFLALGILIGTFTGLIPGIHINLIGVFIISLSSTILFNLNPIYIIVFISAMAITHTFIDFIPSIFLGCPDTDTELSILPGHELLKKGQGYNAILLSAYGSLAAVFILILIAFPSTILIPKFFELIKEIIPLILIGISLILIFLEKKKSKAFFVFIISGMLGLSVLNLENIREPLLPLLSGLFGSSMLIASIKNKLEIPKQEITKTYLEKSKFIKSLFGSLIASPLCSFFPGLGSGQAAIIGNTITNPKQNDKQGFLILLGATNTLVMGFSFISLYAISKTRTGAAVAIQEIIGNLNPSLLILILAVILISGIISFFLTKNLAKFFSQKITKFNYTKISIGTLIFLILIITLVSGFLGLLVFAVSTITGLYCISLGVRRTQMMGCLLLPVIFWGLGIL